MRTKFGKYPVYALDGSSKKLPSRRVVCYFTVEQLLEIANIFYYVGQKPRFFPKIFGGLPLDESKRISHKAIHDACINCVLSMEQKELAEKEGFSDADT